jgi:hypothetical protein
MLHMYNEFLILFSNIEKKLFFKIFLGYQNFVNFQNYLFCQLIHALSPTLCKCAKFQIEWTGRSVLNIDYKICSRQTDRQTNKK